MIEAGDLVRLPEAVEEGPFGEQATYIVKYLPELGVVMDVEVGGILSIRPENWTSEVWIAETEVEPIS